MDGTMIATAYFISLGVFFIFLVIATIAFIVSKARSGKKYRDDYDEDYDYEEEDDESEDTSIFDEAYNQQIKTSVGTDTKTTPKAMSVDDQIAQAMSDLEHMNEELEHEATARVTQRSVPVDSAFAPEQPQQSQAIDSAFAVDPAMDSAFAVQEAAMDSAFAPEQPQQSQAIDSAFAVDTAMDSAFAAQAAAMDSAFSSEVAQQAKPKHARGNYFWFNKEDVEDRPEYKPVEMFYHHFGTAEECIEDLLMEMYDCALVRTEEIRYIAYGIAPRDVAMRDVMATGTAGYNASRKKKEPTSQDIALIYDKWCSYVELLFEKVEIRADEDTKNEIKRLLCEYGKNDVDTLIEGV